MSRSEKRLKAVRRLREIEIFTQEPCAVRWDQMEGTGRVRKCLLCNLNVYDFSSMKPEEILDVIRLHEGRLCAQFFARSDGTMTIEHCNTQPPTAYAQTRLRGRVAFNPIGADVEIQLSGGWCD